MCNPLLLYPFVMVAKSVSTGILKEVILVARLPSSSKSIILSFFKLEWFLLVSFVSYTLTPASFYPVSGFNVITPLD